MEPQLLALLKANDLEQHADLLRKADIKTVAQLSACDSNRLKAVGISVLGERKRLLMLCGAERKKSSAVATPQPRRSKSSSNMPAAPVFGMSLAVVDDVGDDDDMPGSGAPIGRAGPNKSPRSLAQVQFVALSEAEKAAAATAVVAERTLAPPPPKPAESNPPPPRSPLTTKRVDPAVSIASPMLAKRSAELTLKPSPVANNRFQTWARMSMPVASKKEEPRTALLSDESGLSAEELAGGAHVTVSLFSVRTEAYFRNGEVWYDVSSALLKVLTDAPPPSSFSKSMVRHESNKTWLVNRVGFVKLVACAPPSAENDALLAAVVRGGKQFDECEALVLRAESNRRRAIRQAKAAEEEEFREWKKESASKRVSILQQSGRNDIAASTTTGAAGGLRKSVLLNFREVQVKEDKQRNRMTRELGQSQEGRRLRQSMQLLNNNPVKPVQQKATKSPRELFPTLVDDTRVMQDVPFPEPARLSEAEVFSDAGKPNVGLLVKHFLSEGRVSVAAAKRILAEATALLRAEENLVEIAAPVNIFGDIHGQFCDLAELLRKAGPPEETAHLWLGDYVDRGAFGCEVALLLLASKIRWPKRVTMLRGNHESRQMAECFNFKAEAQRKYGLYDAFMDAFDALPLAALVTSGHGSYFCVHGGLSPMIRAPSDVNRLERLEEPPNYGPMCDLLWSDPLELDSSMKPQEFREEYYRDNAGRGCGQMFGPAAVRDFLEDNQVVCIIRAHEVMKEGFREYRFLEDSRPVPMVITLFSAPNYLGSYENKAAMLTVADLSRSISQIVWTTPPFAMPEADNMLVLGLGPIAESVMGFFVSAFDTIVRKAEEAPPDPEEDEGGEPLNFPAIRAKVEAMARAMVAIRAKRKALLRKKLGLPAIDATVKSSDEAFDRTLQSQRDTEANPKLL